MEHNFYNPIYNVPNKPASGLKALEILPTPDCRITELKTADAGVIRLVLRAASQAFFYGEWEHELTTPDLHILAGTPTSFSQVYTEKKNIGSVCIEYNGALDIPFDPKKSTLGWYQLDWRKETDPETGYAIGVFNTSQFRDNPPRFPHGAMDRARLNEQVRLLMSGEGYLLNLGNEKLNKYAMVFFKQWESGNKSEAMDMKIDVYQQYDAQKLIDAPVTAAYAEVKGKIDPKADFVNAEGQVNAAIILTLENGETFTIDENTPATFFEVFTGKVWRKATWKGEWHDRARFDNIARMKYAVRLVK